MVDVVGVHGMALRRTHRSEMTRVWRSALVEGLRDESSPHAETLTFECAFYSHRYHDGKDAEEATYTASDLDEGLETELVLAMAAAVPDEPATGEPTPDEPGKAGYLPGSVQSALVRIQAAKLFGGLDSVFLAFVKQVRRYLDDEEFAEAVRAEVGRAMATGPRVVIGHSLGSVVAYDWLRIHRPPDPPALVTIGSPLGMAAIRRRLRVPPLGSAWPGNVTSWTNVAAREDAVAMVKELRPHYHTDVVDLPCRNGRTEAHSAERYLSNVRTATAVMEALG